MLQHVLILYDYLLDYPQCQYTIGKTEGYKCIGCISGHSLVESSVPGSLTRLQSIYRPRPWSHLKVQLQKDPFPNSSM